MPVLHQLGQSSHVRYHRRAALADAFGHGVGEGLRQRADDVDVRRREKLAHIFYPAGKRHVFFKTQLACQRAEAFPVLAVARDHEMQPRRRLHGTPHRPQERRNVLDLRQPRRDHADDVSWGVCIAVSAPVRRPIRLRQGWRVVDAVVDRKAALRVESARDHRPHHPVGNAGIIVDSAQRAGVDRAERELPQRRTEVVELVIGVNRRHDRQRKLALQQRAHQIRPRAVAVQDIRAVCADELIQPPVIGKQVARRNDLGIDARAACGVGKIARAEGHQFDVQRLPEPCRERNHRGFRAADVAAADNVENFHTVILSLCKTGWFFNIIPRKLPLVKPQKPVCVLLHRFSRAAANFFFLPFSASKARCFFPPGGFSRHMPHTLITEAPSGTSMLRAGRRFRTIFTYFAA